MTVSQNTEFLRPFVTPNFQNSYGTGDLLSSAGSVEKIVVHECSYDENKTRRQDIEIYYSFVGKVDLPE